MKCIKHKPVGSGGCERARVTQGSCRRKAKHTPGPCSVVESDARTWHEGFFALYPAQGPCPDLSLACCTYSGGAGTSTTRDRQLAKANAHELAHRWNTHPALLAERDTLKAEKAELVALAKRLGRTLAVLTITDDNSTPPHIETLFKDTSAILDRLETREDGAE